MLALELEKTDVKEFMSKLLKEELFDSFEARVVEISAGVNISIDGALEVEGEDASKGGFSAWSDMRSLVYEIIKHCAKPRFIKIIFSHKNTQDISENAAALFLNMVYENDSVSFTTAAAQKEFALDKSLDIAWDEWMHKFFANAGLNVTERE